MKKVWFVLFGLILGVQISNAQFNFRQHKVEPGDDVYSIAQLYQTTPESIFQLNPQAKNGIQPGTYLVIPNVIKVPELPVKGIEFKKHKTKKKQTLYSIAKKYKVTVEDIKKYNTFLEENELKKGDILRIPLPAPKSKRVFRNLNKQNEVIRVEKENDSLATQIYKIQPKDTRYGVARKFGITIPELENMNPNLGDQFPIGLDILIPAKAKKESTIVPPSFKFYEVPPKQTMYSLCREYGISKDSIFSLNPELKEGLKAGMVLQLPKKDYELENSEVIITNLQDKLFDFEEKKIAVLLPFGVANYTGNDSSFYKNELEKNRVTRFVVDFYSGLKLAFEKAKEYGANLKVVVADTQKEEKVVKELIVSKDLQNVDAVIGPIYSKNISKVGEELEALKVPVFTPMSYKLTKKYSNIYQSRPTQKILEQKIINFVKKDTLPKNIIIIADKSHEANKKLLLSAFKEAKVIEPVKDNYIKEKDLIEIMGEDKSEQRNFVFIESSNLLLVSNVVSFLNARASTHKVTLFTTSKNKVYDNDSVSNRNLSNLNFHYPSTNKIVEDTSDDFFTAFEKKYGKSPNKYAIRGFDLGTDIVLRLLASSNLSDLNSANIITEYLENKFSYVITEDGGFTNNMCYIMKYSEGLTFEVVE